MTISIREADERLEAAINERVAAANAEVKSVILDMMDYVPEAGFAETFWPQHGPSTTGGMTIAEAMDQWTEYRKTEGLDAKDIPFFSEAYLYDLIGKNDARSVLSFLGALARAIGYKDGIYDLRRERRKI